MRRLTETTKLTSTGTSWSDMIRNGRLSNASSPKRANRSRHSAGGASLSNVPNPFTSSTLVEFTLPEESMIDLEIFNTAGQVVARLVANGRYRAGDHRVMWDANDLPNGTYLIKLRYNNEIITERSVLMR